jgi:transcriptional regulator with XRE-family HTH domain
MAQSFGEKIRALRKEKGLTLDQLAERTESSKSYIWELENKNPPRPSAEKIGKIAAELGVTSDYLMDEKDQKKETAQDLAFYRKYKAVDPETKEKVRQMLELIIKK